MFRCFLSMCILVVEQIDMKKGNDYNNNAILPIINTKFIWWSGHVVGVAKSINQWIKSYDEFYLSAFSRAFFTNKSFIFNDPLLCRKSIPQRSYVAC